MPTLHVLQGPDKGRVYGTGQEPAVIGRTTDQIQLTDNSASRRHAEIRPENGHWILTDLNSSNGTYLNGRRIVSPTQLKHGDQIKVGSSLMVFGGDESDDGFSTTDALGDMVELGAAGEEGESSILSAVDASEDSVILQPPETADAVAAWNVVYRIAEMMGTIEPVDAFLVRVCDLIFDHLIVDRLVMLMRKADATDLTPVAVRLRHKVRGPRPKILTSRTIINHVLETRSGVLCANAMTDDRFSRESKQDSIHHLGLRSVMCVPVIARDVVHGVIQLDCTMSHHTYTQEQLRLAVVIGRLTGMAIENARLLESRVRHERLAAAGETVAYLSHHIRNILQGLQGGAETVELGIKRAAIETVSSGWSIVRRNLDRTLYLAANMLTFAKDRRPRIESTALNPIIEEVVALVQTRADEKGVMLLTELEELPDIPLDPHGIHQVAHNIVLNAIDATPADTGRVNIRTTFDAVRSLVLLSISDNGPGIEDAAIDRIFEAFHSSKGNAGTGLGLAAAKKIVEELHGEISVQSTIGSGTTFSVKLPTVYDPVTDTGETHRSSQ